ncbi:MAG TPA: hypothetical protein VJL29_02330 [Thermoguttaceae bacterium]|nr:hypothetical protein [Thermoguttaceae bacterium]
MERNACGCNEVEGVDGTVKLPAAWASMERLLQVDVSVTAGARDAFGPGKSAAGV